MELEYKLDEICIAVMDSGCKESTKTFRGLLSIRGDVAAGHDRYSMQAKSGVCFTDFWSTYDIKGYHRCGDRISFVRQPLYLGGTRELPFDIANTH